MRLFGQNLAVDLLISDRFAVAVSLPLVTLFIFTCINYAATRRRKYEGTSSNPLSSTHHETTTRMEVGGDVACL